MPCEASLLENRESLKSDAAGRGESGVVVEQRVMRRLGISVIRELSDIARSSDAGPRTERGAAEVDATAALVTP